MLDEEKFIDRLRQIQKPNSWLGLHDFMETVKCAYRKDFWIDQPDYIEIWIEKDALRDVVSPITKEYDITLLVVRGHASTTAVTDTYNRFTMRAHKSCYLYYFGDFDPSGIAIYESLKQRLQGKRRNGDSLHIRFNRVALNMGQIKRYSLPPAKAKKTDPNSKKFIKRHGDNVVELDALPPDVLMALVRETIEQHIDWDLWNEMQETEGRETEELQGVRW